MRNQKGHVAGYNGQLVVTADQVIVGATLSRHPVEVRWCGLVSGQSGIPAPRCCWPVARARRASIC
jgi:hypothetical protein